MPQRTDLIDLTFQDESIVEWVTLRSNPPQNRKVLIVNISGSLKSNRNAVGWASLPTVTDKSHSGNLKCD
ncbi:MAG: hypothetical protein IJ780_03940 [Neisseriaceae bacterium]|nr:hypothetical protein [Neisseriaceae bacterium]